MKCKECSSEDIVARGLCNKCYHRLIEKEKSAICVGCKKFKPIKTQGMCRKCYQRYLRHGDPTRERKKKGDKLCSYCHKRPVHAKGYCVNCYARYLKNGKPDVVKVRVEKECSFCGKVDFLKAKGLCTNCYSRFLKTDSPEYTQIKNVAICGFCEEEKEIVGRGLCASCYQRYRKNGTPEYVKVKHICKIKGCNDFCVAQGLCNTHYVRWKKHGHTDQTRPKGWGSKEKHPLYQTWWWLKRKEPYPVLCDAWKDFWKFVEDVGKKPSKKHRFFITDQSKIAGKDNYDWRKGPIEKRDDETNKEFRLRYGKQWRRDNKAKSKEDDLLRRHNINFDGYCSLQKKQNNVCAICGNPEIAIDQRGKLRNLAVDHCHKTGKIRGLLCTNCNKGLGHFKDSPDLLTKAIEYLKTT